MSEEVIKQTTDAPVKKAKKEKSLTRKIIEWVLFGIFGILFAFVLAGNIDGMVNKNKNYGQSIRFGFGSFIVLTTSMEPDIKKGSAILTYREDVKTFANRLEKGETIDITFANVPIQYYIIPDTPEFQKGELVTTNQIMTHRLREVHMDESIPYGKGRYIFVTSGINTQGEASLEGQYQEFTEKEYLGVVKASNGVLGSVFNFVISPVGLILLLLIPAVYLIVVSSIDIFKTLKASEEAEGSPTGDKLNKLSDDDRERLKKELLEEMIKAKRGDKGNDKKD